MATTPSTSDNTAPASDNSAPVSGDQQKDSSPAAPTQVAPGDDGVQVGGLKYTTNVDGTRNYPDQKPVKTQDDPTPQPETKSETSADEPKPTDAPAGS